MAFTDEEENRISLIETSMNKIMKWLGNTFSKKQGRQMTLNQQETINNILLRVETLESQVSTIITRLDSIPD